MNYTRQKLSCKDWVKPNALQVAIDSHQNLQLLVIDH